jgi:hypothetical protein
MEEEVMHTTLTHTAYKVDKATYDTLGTRFPSGHYSRDAHVFTLMIIEFNLELRWWLKDD